MSKPTSKPASKPKKRQRKRPPTGGAWPRRAHARADVERACVVVLAALRQRLGREPTDHEVADDLGVGVAAARALLARTRTLSDAQRRCLVAVVTLESRLGRSPSTREVSALMGVAPSGSRYHIRRLAALGILTPPEMRLVLTATDAGRSYLPRGGALAPEPVRPLPVRPLPARPLPAARVVEPAPRALPPPPVVGCRRMGGGGAAYRITIDGVDTAHRAEREPAPPGYWRLMQDGEREPVAITKTRRDCIARFADLFARDRRGAA